MDENIGHGDKFDTLIWKAHSELKSNIIAGVHLPGEKLRVEHLKQRYGVSGGTLREALTMLIADRLVIAEGQRGFRVKPVSISDLIDLNRIRIVLEKEAIRQSISCGDARWEGKVVSAFHLLTRATRALEENPSDTEVFDDWERWHREFHIALFSADPSEWTRYFLDIAYQQCERYRYMFHALTQDMVRGHRERDVQAEHTAILDAVLERDANTASKLLEQHLMRTLDEWVEFFDTAGALDPGKADAPGKRRVGKGEVKGKKHRKRRVGK